MTRKTYINMVHIHFLFIDLKDLKNSEICSVIAAPRMTMTYVLDN